MIKRAFSLFKTVLKFFSPCAKTILSLVKAAPRLTLSWTKRILRFIRATPRFVLSHLKEVALLLLCGIFVMTLLTMMMNMVPDALVPSKQNAGNLPDLVPSSTYDYKNSVVRLYNDKGFFCSGVVIGNNYVLTASHCLIDENGWMRADEEVTVVSGDGSIKMSAKPAGVNTRMDWGLLLGDFSSVPGALVTEAGFQTPTAVVGCGYPQGARSILCQVLTPFMNDGFFVKCRVGGMIFPGMSGGPVFDENGYLVGLNILAYPALQQLGGVAYTPVVGILANFHIADY